MMDLGSMFLLIVALFIVVPALLFWINERLMSSVRRDEMEKERRPRMRKEDDDGSSRPAGNRL